MRLREVSDDSFDRRLDHMIHGVMIRYKGFLPKNASLENIRRLVKLDYEDSDITKVTPRDIVEIIDASVVGDADGEEMLRI
jgi:hypothetical protein